MSDLPPPTPPEVPPAVPEPAPPEVPPVVEAPSLADATPPAGNDPAPKDANEKTLGLVMHLLPLAGFLLASISLPFGNLLAPLIFWLVKKAESPYLDAHGKEVLNFQINVTAVGMVCFILSFLCIGIPMLIALGITSIVLMVMAAIKVNEGHFYRYPWIYRIIK